MNTNHLTHLIRVYDSTIIFSDVSIDILARNKCSLLTYLLLAFDWYIYVWPSHILKIKIVHISTEYLTNGSDRTNILLPILTKLPIGFRLVYLHLSLAYSKDQGQAYFDSEYLVDGDIYDKHCYCHYTGNRLLAFNWYIYIWHWPILKVKVKIIRNSIAKNSIKLSHALRQRSCCPFLFFFIFTIHKISTSIEKLQYK